LWRAEYLLDRPSGEMMRDRSSIPLGVSKGAWGRIVNGSPPIDRFDGEHEFDELIDNR
jgi:hypothetical protein